MQALRKVIDAAASYLTVTQAQQQEPASLDTKRRRAK